MPIVAFSTQPPNVSLYGETSVPPPPKPRRSGARARTLVTRAEWPSSARTLIVGWRRRGISTRSFMRGHPRHGILNTFLKVLRSGRNDATRRRSRHGAALGTCRLSRHRRRLGRLRAGLAAERGSRHAGAAVRGRTRRDAIQHPLGAGLALSGPHLFPAGMAVGFAAGLARRQRHQPAHRAVVLRAGPPAGRRVVDQRHLRQPWLALRLR